MEPPDQNGPNFLEEDLKAGVFKNNGRTLNLFYTDLIW